MEGQIRIAQCPVGLEPHIGLLDCLKGIVVHEYILGCSPVSAREERLIPRVLLHSSLDDIISAVTGRNSVVLGIAELHVDTERKPFSDISGNIGLDAVLIESIAQCCSFLMLCSRRNVVPYLFGTT